jgi:hypothetical protein
VDVTDDGVHEQNVTFMLGAERGPERADQRQGDLTQFEP